MTVYISCQTELFGGFSIWFREQSCIHLFCQDLGSEWHAHNLSVEIELLNILFKEWTKPAPDEQIQPNIIIHGRLDSFYIFYFVLSIFSGQSTEAKFEGS